MTVAAQNVAPQAVAAAGQTVFPFAWRCDNSSLVAVWVNNIQDGGFAVALNADQTAAPGGTITRASACLGGEVVTVERVSALTQTAAFTKYGPFPASTITNFIDSVVMLAQEARALIDRTLRAARSNVSKFSSLELPDPQDGSMIAFQADVLQPGKFKFQTALSASKEYVDGVIQAILGGGAVNAPLSWVATGDGINTDYAVANAPFASPDLYYVVVDGVPQEPVTSYTMDITVNPALIKFTEVVPLNSRIYVRVLGYAKGVNVGDTSLITALAGTVARSLATRFSDEANVKDFNAKGDDATDDTIAIRAAIATGKVVVFPPGAYRISGQLVGTAAWRGGGQGNAFDSNVGTGATIIRCVGANGGTPFIVPPHDVQGIHFDGMTSNNTGIVLGADASFVAFYRWRNVTVRRFNLGIHIFNIFATDFSNFVVQGNHEGIRIDPADTVADDGYFTSTAWKNIYIADNDVYGLYAVPPLGSRTWSWTNVVIERNGANGTYQCLLQNIVVDARGLYVEGTPAKPGIQTNNVSIYITNGYVNGTGGFNLTSNAVKLILIGVNFTSASDVIAGLSALSFVRAEACNLQTDVKAVLGARAVVLMSAIAGGTTIGKQLSDNISNIGDADATLTVGTSSVVNRVNVALTANRTLTLATVGAARGDKFRVVRAGTEAFSLNVGGLKTIPVGTAGFVEVMYDGAAWQLTAFGTL